MRIGVTGATGLAGHRLCRYLRGAGHEVVTLGRRRSPLGLAHRGWTLGEIPDLSGLDALLHAAFAHVPGRYRGGEGGDPEGFLRLNRDGSLRLVEAARGQTVVFLSSRAVYGAYPPGTRLSEEMTPRPDTLYGRMKREVEEAVGAQEGVSLRATGLYGPPPPGRSHKWRDLFDDFAEGRRVAPRVASEVHVDDLAAAAELVLDGAAEGHLVLNVSDIVLDRRDLLETWSRMHGVDGALPERADAARVSEMDTSRLRQAGWRPRGRDGLAAALAELA